MGSYLLRPGYHSKLENLGLGFKKTFKTSKVQIVGFYVFILL